MTLLKQKNSIAFESLYDKYAAPLYTVILQILRTKEEAENVLKKVFTTIRNKVGEYDSEKGSIFIWMLHIARTTALAEIKSRNHTVPLSSLPEEDPAIDNFGLKKIINCLVEDQKKIINLYYYKGFTIKQIAESVSISENLVRTTINTALSELTTILSNK